jgi:hypothetical protein
MTHIATLLSSLRRPRMLIRAARFGQSDYRRDRDLRRLVVWPASPEAAVQQLLEEEGRLERIRQNGDAAYSVSRHIEVLIALIAEARSLRAPA